MVKSILLTVAAIAVLGAGVAAVSSQQESAVQAKQVSAQNEEARALSETLAKQTQERAKVEELRLNLRAMSELLAHQLADLYVERDEADRKFDDLDARIDAAIAIDEQRMKEVNEQVDAFTARILALTTRINETVEGSAEQERLIRELAAMNAEVDKKAEEAKIALDELHTRQDNLRLTLNSLNEELGTEKGRAEKRESEAASLLEDVRAKQARVAVLKYNITWYENRRAELQRIIATKNAMARIKAKFPFGGGISLRPQDLVLGPVGATLPTIGGGGGHPPISIGGPGGGVRVGGRKLF